MRFLLFPLFAQTAHMAPSSCLISGVFPLSDGSRNADPSYYATYLSALEFTKDENFINVSVRKYTALTDTLYVDDTFVYMVAKAALPTGEDGMLDSIHCAPFTSPSGGFEPCCPSKPTHTAFVTGTVSGVDTSTSIRSFTLTTSEYVRNERRAFDVRYVLLPTSAWFLSLTSLYSSFTFDGTSNRWKNVPLPAIGSMVSATGIFEDVVDRGPILALLNMSYGPSETAVASPTRIIGHRSKAGR